MSSHITKQRTETTKEENKYHTHENYENFDSCLASFMTTLTTKSLGIKKLTYPIIMYRSEIGSKPRYAPDRVKKWGIYAAVKSYFWTWIGSLKIKQLMTDTARWNQSQLILKLTRENAWSFPGSNLNRGSFRQEPFISTSPSEKNTKPMCLWYHLIAIWNVIKFQFPRIQ